jgi:hypothetical protein
MKAYYYEINGYFKGVTEAKHKWEAKRYSKRLAKRFFPNIKIKSVKVSRIQTNEPLYSEA